MSAPLNLWLHRHTRTDETTIGTCYVDGRRQCFILEDIERPGQPKIYGQTAIPRGRYEIQITWSPRFKRDLPLLLNVPGFQGVRIHPGNKAADTEGCLLPGETAITDRVLESRIAFDKLFALLSAAKQAGRQMFITISDQPPVIA